MHIIPHLIVDGQDFSRYFISAHCEMTANSTKDPNKYDIVLANIGGRFTGLFKPRSLEEQIEEETGVWDSDKKRLGDMAPKRKISLDIITRKSGCEGDKSVTVKIFSGEIQKAECDEVYCKIEGSCTQGGMSSRIEPRVWSEKPPITTIVNDILDMFGGIPVSKRHIYPAKNSSDDINPCLDAYLDFDTALYEVSCWAESIYFFDENDDFWFVPATDLRGFTVLKKNVLRSSNASNMVGYCNWVDVYGGTIGDGEASEGGSAGTISERKSHNLIYAFAKAPDIEIEQRGLMRAPPVKIPHADQKRCQEVADKLLEWYRQYVDVPTIKVVGKAPGILSKVAYWPWNGSIPPVKCGGDEERIRMDPAMGLVTRRIVDVSAETGFVTTLDITTNFLGVNKPTGDEDVMNFYNLNRERIDNDPEVKTKFPGVFFPE